jgi:hypothetical protein
MQHRQPYGGVLQRIPPTRFQGVVDQLENSGLIVHTAMLAYRH